jgi:hypothetical protein
VRGVGVVHRRPDGSGCQGGVGASRGAKQAGPGPGRRAQCSTRCCTGAGGLWKALFLNPTYRIPFRSGHCVSSLGAALPLQSAMARSTSLGTAYAMVLLTQGRSEVGVGGGGGAGPSQMAMARGHSTAGGLGRFGSWGHFESRAAGGPYRGHFTGPSGAHACGCTCRSPCTCSPRARARSDPCRSPCTCLLSLPLVIAPVLAPAARSPCRSPCLQ